MKKLELKDIIGYLPYDLHYHCEYYDGRKRVGRYHIANIIADLEYLPILRPLSDLYKTVLHNGKEIIPIVECAKTVNNKKNWRISKTCQYHAVCDGYILLISEYRDIGGILIHYMDENTRAVNIVHHKVFDCLHELKIDYRGLIDAGLAIDANTLETNPYK